MTKQGYNKMLAKLEQKARNRKIEFFKSIPFFATWSKSQITKLIQSFTLKKYKRGQFVMNEKE